MKLGALSFQLHFYFRKNLKLQFQFRTKAPKIGKYFEDVKVLTHSNVSTFNDSLHVEANEGG